jgi:hypothetical protein
VAARVEIAKLSAPKAKVSAFSLEGIYINYYYPTRTFIGGNGTVRKDNGQTTTKYVTTSGGEYEGFSNILCDEYGTALAATDVSDRMTATPATRNNVWAYNLTVPDATVTGYFPHIVLKLKATTADFTNQTKYLTVRTATHATGGGAVEFTKGNIYQIGDIQFADNDLFDTLEPTLSTLAVTATIKQWVFTPINVSF